MIEVKKCIGGLAYWDVLLDGVRLERFDRRKNAMLAADHYKTLVGRM